MKKSDLIGVWELISFKIHEKNGNTLYPYGKDAIGYIIYTPDNMVSVHMMSAKRLQNNQYQYQSGTDIEKIEGAENYGGYIGAYELKDNLVIHFPKLCGFPTLLNTLQPRELSLSSNRLTLSHLDPTNQIESLALWEKTQTQ